MATELGVEQVELTDEGVSIEWTGRALQLLRGEVSAYQLRLCGVCGRVDEPEDLGPGDG